MTQVVAVIVAAGILYLIATGQPGFSVQESGFAANDGEHSPGGYSLLPGLFAEVFLTFVFLFIRKLSRSYDLKQPSGSS